MEGDSESQSPKPETPTTPSGRGRKRKDTTDSSENTPQQAEARKRLRPRRSRDISYPKTLEGFQCKFNEDGELRHIETGEKFDMNELDDEESNDKRFEALAEAIAEHVYELLEKECELEKQTVPVEPKKSDVEGFIFTSSDATTNDKLIIFINGTETSKSGQWSTKLIVEEGLDSGSQLPYIKKAKELGYGVLVMNPNQNSVLAKWNAPKSIRGSENPDKHVDYVWKNFVRDFNAKHIAIIAYTQGGSCMLKLAHLNADDFQKRVFAVAIADSTHSMTKSSLKKQVKTHLVKIGKNFTPSDEQDFGEEIPGGRAVDIPMVSAGDIESAQTCSKCMDSIFDFIAERYEEAEKETAETVEESPKAKTKKSPRKKKSKVAEEEEEATEEPEEKPQEEEKVAEEEREEEEEKKEEPKEDAVEEKEEEEEEEEEEEKEKCEEEEKEMEVEKEEPCEEKEEEKNEVTEAKPEQNDVKASESETNSEEKQEKMEVDEVQKEEEKPKEEVKEKTVNGTDDVEIDEKNEVPKEKSAEKMEVDAAPQKVQESQEVKPAEAQAV